jgi:putative flippase GtrA
MRLKEITKFLASGAFNTLLGYLLYLLFNLLLPYIVAYTAAYLLTIFTSYYLHSIYVFEENITLKKAAQYPLMYLFLYIINTTLLYVFVEKFGINENIAPVIILLIIVPLTYLFGRIIIKGKFAIDSSDKT